jgi:pyrroline-5-carboxylate reductase
MDRRLRLPGSGERECQMATFAGKTFGFIGGGIIAEVFIQRLLDSGTAKPAQILVSDPRVPVLDRLQERLGVRAAAGNMDAAGADIVFLATPPPATVPVLREIASVMRPDRLVLSMAAAVSLGLMEEALGGAIPVVRLVVNTPAQVGRGMTAFCCGRAVSPGQREVAIELLQIFGRVVEVPEDQIATVAAVAAVGPTYIFPVIGVLVDVGVAYGLTPELARTLACQVVAGSATLAAETMRSPQDLTQMISLRTLDEVAARELFGRAVTEARTKLISAAEKVQAAAR